MPTFHQPLNRGDEYSRDYPLLESPPVPYLKRWMMSNIDRTPDTYPQQPQPRTFKARVVAEFVDEIPTPADHFRKYKTSWESQDGFKEGLEKAFRNPRRAMLLVTYDGKDSPSKRREMAKLRAKSLGDQGYSERMGWTVRPVDFSVYVMYNPTENGF